MGEEDARTDGRAIGRARGRDTVGRRLGVGGGGGVAAPARTAD